MLAATVIQYSVPALVSGNTSATRSSTTTLNPRWRSETAAIQVSSPEAFRRREGAAQRGQHGEEGGTRVRVDHAALPTTGEHPGHEEQHEHEDDEQQQPLDEARQLPGEHRALSEPARGAADDGQHTTDEGDDRAEGGPVRNGDGAEATALDDDVETVDHRDGGHAPAEAAHDPAGGRHLRHGHDDDREAEQEQVEAEAGDPERVDEEVERGLVGVGAVVEHERRPRQVGADDRQHTGRDAQRGGDRRQPGDHARTRSVSPKKPCGRNTSTPISTTKIQT